MGCNNRRKEIICQLKCLLDDLANEPPPPRTFILPCCIPTDPHGKQSIPDVMVCYKSKKDTDTGRKKDDKLKFDQNADSKLKSDSAPVQTCKSRELLGGVLYVGCDCGKRNGLQDDCRRTQCQGSPACLTKPEPTCCPSQFSNAKHLMAKMFKNEVPRDGNAGGSNYDSKGVGEKKDAAGEKFICFPAVVQCCDCD